MTAAHLAHATRGRARLRLPSVKGEAAFFERLARELCDCTAVTSVKVNASTGSVLIRHQGALDAVLSQARERGMIEMVSIEPAGDPLADLREKVREANDSLRRRTKNGADLRSLAFTALLGGSAYQLLRGAFLPAGGTMLMQALDLLFGSSRRAE